MCVSFLSFCFCSFAGSNKYRMTTAPPLLWRPRWNAYQQWSCEHFVGCDDVEVKEHALLYVGTLGCREWCCCTWTGWKIILCVILGMNECSVILCGLLISEVAEHWVADEHRFFSNTTLFSRKRIGALSTFQARRPLDIMGCVQSRIPPDGLHGNDDVCESIHIKRRPKHVWPHITWLRTIRYAWDFFCSICDDLTWVFL